MLHRLIRSPPLRSQSYSIYGCMGSMTLINSVCLSCNMQCSMRFSSSNSNSTSSTKLSKLVGRRKKHLVQSSGAGTKAAGSKPPPKAKQAPMKDVVTKEKSAVVSNICVPEKHTEGYYPGPPIVPLTSSEGDIHTRHRQRQNYPSTTSTIATLAKSYEAQYVLFSEQREKIISNLLANKNDKSLAGGVDVAIRPLVALINSSTSFVTLSSCSGRFSVYHRVVLKDDSAENSDSHQSASRTSASTAKKKRGLGIGTVYSSHDAFEDSDIPVIANKIARSIAIDYHFPFFLNSNAKARVFDKSIASIPLLDRSNIREESLEIKFEPTILHVMCRTFGDAHRLLAAAVQSGHRQSGLSISPLGKNAKMGGKRGLNVITSKSTTATEEYIYNAQIDDILEDVTGWKISLQIQSPQRFDTVLYMAPAMGEETLVPFLNRSNDVVKYDRKKTQGKTAGPQTNNSNGELEVSEELVAVCERMVRVGNQLFADNIRRREKFVALLHSRGVLKDNHGNQQQ